MVTQHDHPEIQEQAKLFLRAYDCVSVAALIFIKKTFNPLYEMKTHTARVY
jgi:hypothetical protein